MDTVLKFTELPTRTEGIFVMPRDRITIHSTFVVRMDDPLDTVGATMVRSRNDVAVVGAAEQRQSSTTGVILSHTGDRTASLAIEISNCESA
jgi:hypothetical protein